MSLRLLYSLPEPIIMEKNLHPGIFASLASGSTEAFGRIAGHYHPILAQYIRRYVHNDEELVKDIVSETLAVVWVQRTSLSSKEDPGAWMRRVAYNIAMSKLRKKKKQWAEPLEAYHSLQSDRTADTILLGRELGRLLEEALHTLSPREQQVFLLSRTDGLKAREIADYLGISEQTVKNQLSTALQKMRRYLRKKWYTLLLW